MDENLRLLVLETREQPKDRRIEFRAERRKLLAALAAAGVKVRHDSGGRLIVVDVSAASEKALAAIAGARFLPLDTELKDSIADLDSTESLFLDALKIRTSKGYRDAKSRRTVGDTPEERELISGPDVREEY